MLEHTGQATRRGGVLLLALATALVGLALVPVTPASAATTLRCGATVTHSVTLTRNLGSCDGPALVVGASGITVDLGGHQITGADVTHREQCEEDGPDSFTCHPCDEAGYPDCGPPFATPGGYVDEYVTGQEGPAIVNEGYDGVTVRHGSFTNYDMGYRADRVDGFVASGLTGAPVTVQLEHATHGRVSDVDNLDAADVSASRVQRTSDIFMQGSAGNRVTENPGEIWLFGHSDHNLVVDNITTGFKVIYINDSDDNVVRHNQLNCPSCVAEPIFLSDGASGNLIEDNTMSGMVDGAYGIVLREADRNTVRQNTIGPAYRVGGFPDSGGVAVCASDGNTVVGNLITSTYVGVGVDNDSSCDQGASHGTTIRGNRIRGARGAGDYVEQTGDGITVGAIARHTVVAGNVVRGSQHDGIDVRSPSAVLSDNLVVANRDLGIRAVRGVVDGGGNVARDNGDPRQCVNVDCG
jgi:parallel beta-helix repeat protein